ncbi:SPRY domain-containing protein 3 [Globodera pallida]|nr:SPRY domain-containing protein 3 [Globodera pallida]
MPKKDGIFYYEVKLFGKGPICIGLGIKQMKLGGWVGENEDTYANRSNGDFLGHLVDGCREFFDGGREARFGGGDVVGCGVDLTTRQIIYTKNGRRLTTTGGSFVDSTVDLFPRVTLYCSGDKIEANFGPNFKYKF